MSDATVKLGNGNWATKENNLLAYKQVGGKYLNTEFTVARGTDATYVGRDGLIKQMSDSSFDLVTNGDFSAAGINLVTNPNFTDLPLGADWNSIDGDIDTYNENGVTITSINTDSFNRLYQGLVTDDGKSYKVTYTIHATSYSTGTVAQYYDGDTYNALPEQGVGTHTFYFTRDAANDSWYFNLDASASASTTDYVTISSISVQELGEGWNHNSIWQFGNNRAIAVSANYTSGTSLNQSSVLEVGKYYKVSFEVLEITSGAFEIRAGAGGTYSPAVNSVGTYTYYLQATDPYGTVLYMNCLSTTNGAVSNISVKQISDVVGDVPRIDFLNNPQGHLLLEPQRSNLIPYSNKLSTMTTALKAGGTVTTTDNYAVSPDGTYNAQRLQASAPAYDGSTTTWGLKGFSTTDGSNGDAYSSSIYLKSNTGTNQQVAFYVRGITGISHTVTSEWQRFELTGERGSANFYTYVGVRPDLGSDLTCDISVYGWQVEAGAYSTSYIPTNGTAILRSGETCTGAGAAKDFNDSEGVFYAEIATDSDGTDKTLSIGNGVSGSTNNRLWMGYSTAAKRVYSLGYVNNGLQFSFNKLMTDETAFVKIACKYKQNDVSFYVNGEKIGTDDSALEFIGLNNLAFNIGYNSTSASFYGKTNGVQVFNTALVDDELEYLTTNGDLPEWSSFEGMAVAYNYTVK